MNKIYRIVWNPALLSWVAVCEFAKAKGKGKNGRTRLATTAASVAGAMVLAMIPLEEARAYVAGSSAATDAVNGSQHFASYSAINNLDADVVDYDSNTDGTVNYNSITLSGDTYDSSTHTGGTTISSVSYGVNGGDAVNVDQLNEVVDGAKAHYYSVNDYDVIGDNYDNDGAIGRNSLAAGVGALSQGQSSLAIGTNVKSIGESSIAVGYGANSQGINSITLGVDATTTKPTSTGAIAIGWESLAADTDATALGAGAKAQKSASTAIGPFANAEGDSSIALGSRATAMDESGIALGSYSKSVGTGSMALGKKTVANYADDVALGSNSVTDAAVATTGTTIAGEDYIFAGINPQSTVSVGSLANERTITHVAAGRISASSTDAINGSQLFATNTAINSLNTDITNLDAGSVKYDTFVDGTINYNSVTLGGDTYDNNTHTGGTTITNVADGVAPSDAVNFSQLTNLSDTVNNIYNTGTKYFHANSTGADSQALGEDSVAIGMGAVANNANDIALGAGSITDVTTGTAGVTLQGVDYAFAGANPISQVSVGTKGNERLITNVAAGHLSADSTDAINGSQLFATNAAINGLEQGAVKYDVNADGTVNYNSVTLGGDTYNSTTRTGGTRITNVARGVDDSDAVNMSQLNETNASVTNITDTVNNFAGDQSDSYTEINGRGIRYVRTNDAGLALADAYANGQGSTAVGYNARSTGLNSMALGRNAQSINDGDVALGSGSITEAAMATTGTRINDVDYDFAGINPLSTVSVGSRGKERTITNVAAGRLSADSTDAVNGSQLFATNSAINGLDKGFVKYDINDDGTVNYNHITLGGDTYNSTTKTGGTRISNVSYGVDPSDAVNVQQLTDATTNIYNNGTKYFHANSDKADSVASGMDSIAVGPNAQSIGDGSIAMGDEAKSSGKGSAAIGQGAQTLGDNSVAMGTGAIANNANDVALGAGSVTQAAVATSSITINGDTYAVAGNNPTSTVSVGSEGNERTITNVAAGRIAADSTDAVNGSELYATNQAVEKISGDIINLDAGSVKYEINSDGTINYNKVIMGGDTYDNSTHTGGTTITNVANGEAPSDAVNKYQLDQVDQHVTNISNGTDGMFQVNNTSNLPKPKPTGKDSTAGGAGAAASGDYSTSIGANSKASHNNSVALGSNSVTDRDNSVSVGSVGNTRQITNVTAGTADTDAVNVGQLKQGVNNSYQYTNQKFNDLKNMVDDQKDKLSAGVAGAMAMAGLPQPYQPGASMVGLAGGTYQGQSAIALGVSTISDNGKWVTKLSGTTNSQGDVGAAVGVGYQF